MYNRILVPLDGSQYAEKALSAAKKLLASAKEGHLVLLRVSEVPSASSWTAHDVLQAQETEKRLYQQYLDGISAGLDLPSVETIVHPGPSAAQAVAEMVKSKNIDLVAMTSHGRSALHRFMLGSETEKTLRLVGCSVLVVRDDE